MKKILLNLLAVILLPVSNVMAKNNVQDFWPTMSINNVRVTGTSVTYDVTIVDNDSIVLDAYASVSDIHGSLCYLAKKGTSTCSFLGLNTNQDYVINAIGHYHFNPSPAPFGATHKFKTLKSPIDDIVVSPKYLSLDQGTRGTIALSYKNKDNAVINKVTIDGKDYTPVLISKDVIQVTFTTNHLSLGLNQVVVEKIKYFDTGDFINYVDIKEIIEVEIK